jgi:uncharacterized protein
MTGTRTYKEAPIDKGSDSRRGERRLDPKLLEILVCPLTKTSLDYDAERQELISRAAGLAYPIRDGIPIMLPEEARKLDER